VDLLKASIGIYILMAHPLVSNDFVELKEATLQILRLERSVPEQGVLQIVTGRVEACQTSKSSTF
jgi:hypothetical protein